MRGPKATLPSAVIQGNSECCWNTTPQRAVGSVTGVSSMRTSPRQFDVLQRKHGDAVAPELDRDVLDPNGTLNGPRLFRQMRRHVSPFLRTSIPWCALAQPHPGQRDNTKSAQDKFSCGNAHDLPANWSRWRRSTSL